MPRSFLVKKPCSHRIPNYRRLLGPNTELQYGDPSAPKQDVTEEGKPPPAVSQELGDAGQKEESDKTPMQTRVGGPELSVCLNGLPFKDSMISVKNRPSDGDCDTPGPEATFLPPPQTVPSCVLEAMACSDFPNAYSMFSEQKPWHFQGPPRRLFSCQQCAKAYTSLGALKMHIRTHTLPCACGICGKAFSRPWLLQGHIRTHTGEKPFSCFHCGRGFADRSNLRAHLQTHSEVKRYLCSGCGKSFSRISLLAKHRDGCCCPLT
ncbi:zinc finger protein SNAI3 [Spea bombifrons]|uniref:zinc finger protein SNAI3 n=1 Tax=Spea bombifrons TaxID=233779 RepID=UPI00234B529D|nr:zinc finger protein SNAI3 [Spea bombifrons]